MNSTAMTRRRFLEAAAVVTAGAVTAAVSGCSAQTGPDPSDVPGGVASDLPRDTAGTPTPGTSGGRPTGSVTGSPAPAGVAYVALRSTVSRRATGTTSAAGPALADFGAAMLRAVSGTDPNTVISPYSLYTVLAMARAGAVGRTATQLDTALRASGVDAQGGVVGAVDAGVVAAVSAGSGVAGIGKGVQFDMANQVWVERDFAVRQSYLDALARQYGVQAVSADFAHQPEVVRVAINAWVAQHTADLIKDLFPPESLGSSTVLALVNAVHLKARWQEPFSLDGSLAFTNHQGAVVRPKAMRSAHPVAFATGTGWEAVTIPYLGGQLAMTLLVPAPGRFDSVLAALDATTVRAASDPGEQAMLTMPPFRTESAPEVLQAAKQLGITDLFSAGSADLSGIGGAPGDLYASTFVHRAVIDVDENGTEAAAATGMGIAASGIAGPIKELSVDRPFLYWIADSHTGAPLFLGTVTDPTV